MSDLSDYPDQWECLCMIDSRGDPLPEIEVVPQERIARLTAERDRLAKQLRALEGDLAEARLHHEQGKWSDEAFRDGLERMEAKARRTLSTIERGGEAEGGEGR